MLLTHATPGPTLHSSARAFATGNARIASAAATNVFIIRMLRFVSRSSHHQSPHRRRKTPRLAQESPRFAVRRTSLPHDRRPEPGPARARGGGDDGSAPSLLDSLSAD